MPQIKEIVEKERQRENFSSGTIFFHLEGTFLRAYETSALLCKEYLPELKASKKKFKDIDTPVVYVGFPLTSLEKFTPEGAEVELKGAKDYEMTLPADLLREELTFDKLGTRLDEWKEEVPMIEQSAAPKQGGSQGKQTVPYSRNSPETIMSIVHDVVSFPIEQKSLLQCTEFLMNVRQRLLNTIC